MLCFGNASTRELKFLKIISWLGVMRKLAMPLVIFQTLTLSHLLTSLIGEAVASPIQVAEESSPGSGNWQGYISVRDLIGNETYAGDCADLMGKRFNAADISVSDGNFAFTYSFNGQQKILKGALNKAGKFNFWGEFMYSSNAKIYGSLDTSHSKLSGEANFDADASGWPPQVSCVATISLERAGPNEAPKNSAPTQVSQTVVPSSSSLQGHVVVEDSTETNHISFNCSNNVGKKHAVTGLRVSNGKFSLDYQYEGNTQTLSGAIDGEGAFSIWGPLLFSRNAKITGHVDRNGLSGNFDMGGRCFGSITAQRLGGSSEGEKLAIREKPAGNSEEALVAKAVVGDESAQQQAVQERQQLAMGKAKTEGEAIERLLSLEDRKTIQIGLKEEGHLSGTADGIFGKGTRSAILAYQESQGSLKSGFLSAGQAAALKEKGQKSVEFAALEEQRRQEEAARRAEEERNRQEAEARRKREAEVARRKAEEERQRLAVIAKQRAEEDRLRKEALARKRAEEERLRLAALEKKRADRALFDSLEEKANILLSDVQSYVSVNPDTPQLLSIATDIANTKSAMRSKAGGRLKSALGSLRVTLGKDLNFASFEREKIVEREKRLAAARQLAEQKRLAELRNEVSEISTKAGFIKKEIPQVLVSKPEVAQQLILQLRDLEKGKGSDDIVLLRKLNSQAEATLKKYKLASKYAEVQKTVASVRQSKSTKVASVPTASPSTPAESASSSKYSDVQFGRYHALVIGNNNYRSIPKLKTAQQDARVIARALEGSFGFKVQLLLDATREDIIRAFDGYSRKLRKTDNLLIYYAGHGWLDNQQGEGFWLPVDAEKDSRFAWIANSTITRTLRGLSAKHVMVVADSCYSGTLTRGLRVELTPGDYIRNVVSKRARMVISSGGIEPVEDKGKGGHSPFASALLSTLKDTNDVITATDLFKKIQRPVQLSADQTPVFADIRKAGHDGGDFIFVRKR